MLSGPHGGGLYAAVCCFGGRSAPVVVCTAAPPKRDHTGSYGARGCRSRIPAVVPLVEGPVGSQHRALRLPLSCFANDPPDDFSGIDWRRILGRGVPLASLRHGRTPAMGAAKSRLAIRPDRRLSPGLRAGWECAFRIFPRSPAVPVDFAFARHFRRLRHRTKRTKRPGVGGAARLVLHAAERLVLSAAKGRLAGRCEYH